MSVNDFENLRKIKEIRDSWCSYPGFEDLEDWEMMVKKMQCRS